MAVFDDNPRYDVGSWKGAERAMVDQWREAGLISPGKGACGIAFQKTKCVGASEREGMDPIKTADGLALVDIPGTAVMRYDVAEPT